MELAGLFWDEEIDFITDTDMAAVGKIDLEVKEAKDKDLAVGIADYLKVQAEEKEDFAICIRRKGKRLEKALELGRKEAKKRRNGQYQGDYNNRHGNPVTKSMKQFVKMFEQK